MRLRAPLVTIGATALIAAGCGGDDDKAASATATGGEAATATATQTTTGPVETTMAPDGTPTTRTAPQANGGAKPPGGEDPSAGDEVPNSTQALITGKGGKLTPDTVSVPPFIAITVELRSGDGKGYALGGGGKSISASANKPGTASFAGLRTGKALKLTGSQGSVTITANAEPGP